MVVKATTAFAAEVCMAEGETRDIPEGKLLSGLLSCGYVTEAKSAKSGKAKEKMTDETERSTD